MSHHTDDVVGVKYEGIRNLSDRKNANRPAIGIDTATSNRNLAGTLVGSCLAILTFLLFFLYPRFQNGEIDAVFFQVTLVAIIVAIYSFSYSGLYYYGLMISIATGDRRVSSNLAIADATLILGILLLALEPTMIMFTLRLILLGMLAAALWISFLLFTLSEARRRQYSVPTVSRNEAHDRT